MRLQTLVIIAIVAACYSCNNTPSTKDPYALTDTASYTLTETLQGKGGVYFKTEIYTNKKDTSLSYVKVYNYGQKVAAVQFYKSEKKHGPTITYNENGTRQLGTYYRNDTVIDMHPFNQ
jgi:antitoxin component YwqK of YwqJK toxin-antitoxin module